jgi:hypothetical protein
MEQNPTIKTPDLIDTTDCLEAIGAICSMKNFLFVIIMLCLLITGGVFCLDQTGRIDKTACTACVVCPMNPSAVGACCMAAKQPCPAQAKPADAREPIQAAAQAVSQNIAAASKKQQVADPNADFAKTVKNLLDSAEQGSTASNADKQLPAILRLRPACQHVALTVKICNFILVLAATMYCLTLLMSLKISLTGRLGGINHISRAFFISLFALVILLPWQVLLPGVVVGAIYTPQELLCQWSAKAQLSVFWLSMCYLRFAGLWLVVMTMLIWSQIRSAKWAKATLRRLGLVR